MTAGTPGRPEAGLATNGSRLPSRDGSPARDFGYGPQTAFFYQRRRASVRLGSSGIIVITRLGCQPVERMPSG